MIKKFVVLVCGFLIILFFCFSQSPLFNNTNFIQPEGDQAFYLWAIKHSINTNNLSEFYKICNWSNSGCADLRATPHEWLSLYFIGQMGKHFNLNEIQAASIYYKSSLILNLISSFLFLYIVINNFVAAFCLAPIVSFQSSILMRLEGHLTLISVWQAFFALTFFWLTLNKIMENNFKKSLFFSGIAGIFICLLQWQTFYYTAFTFVILPFLFLVHNYIFKIKLRSFLSIKKFLPLISILAISMAGFYPVRYTLYGIDNIKNKVVHERTRADTAYFSSKIKDFIRPIEGVYLQKSLNSLGIKFNYPDRGEVHAYLGISIILVFILSLLHYIFYKCSKSFRNRINSIYVINNSSILLGFMVLTGITMFFSTETGGLLINTFISKGLRCFSRISPFVCLFFAATLGIYLSGFKKSISYFILITMLVLTVTETRYHPYLKSLNKDGSTQHLFNNLSNDFKELCKQGSLKLVPQMPNYILGAHTILYLAEFANCNIEGIGPITHINDNKFKLAVGEISWKPNPPFFMKDIKITKY